MVNGYEVGKHYDSIAYLYLAFEANPRKTHLGERVTGLVGSLQGKSVIDLGCGNGFFSRLAKMLGATNVVGVDISQAQIDLARQRNEQEGLEIEFHKADVTQFRTGSRFDVAIAGFVFNYSPSLQVLRQQITRTREYLVFGGRLFAIMSDPEHPLSDQALHYSYKVVQEENGVLQDGSKLRCEFYGTDRELMFYDFKFLWTRETTEGILHKVGFRGMRWDPVKAPSELLEMKSPIRSANSVLTAIAV